MPDAVGSGVAEALVVEGWLPVGLLAEPVVDDDEDGVYDPSDQTESREPPPQNSVLSPLQMTEQLPCRTFSVVMVLPQ